MKLAGSAQRYDLAMHQARAALRDADFSAAEKAFRSALRQQPTDVAARAGLGHALRVQHRVTEALRALREAAGRLLERPVTAGNHDALLDIAFEMQEALAPSESLAVVERVLTATDTSARAHHLRARACLRLGQRDHAVEAARRAVELAPQAVNAQFMLAECELALHDSTAAMSRLESLVAALKTPERARALRLLAEACAATGDHSRAFAYCEEAGKEVARTPLAQSFDQHALSVSLARTREICSDAFFARWAEACPPDERRPPVFLCGYLRSGTTLLEQVFSAHPAVMVSNEAALMPAVLRELARLSGGPAHWTAQLERIGPGGVRRLREHYWASVREQLGPLDQHSILLDKTALNTLNIGLIGVLFPEAHVLFAVRDPRDVCLSCFTQSFELTALTAPWLSWERGVESYAEVMAFWRAIRTCTRLKLLTVRYESMVSDLQATLAPIFSALGLDWREECARFHTHQRVQAVRTPSYDQVSRPLYTHAAGRWRRHADAIERVAGVLAPSLADFDYS